METDLKTLIKNIHEHVEISKKEPEKATAHMSLAKKKEAIYNIHLHIQKKKDRKEVAKIQELVEPLLFSL
jgi:uncharacterized protein (DUF2225 family)